MKKIMITTTMFVLSIASAWSQIVYDPTVAALIVQTHNIAYQLSYWKGQLQLQQLQETKVMNQNVERMRDSIEEQTKIMGDPSKTSLGISTPMPSSLEVKTVEDIVEEAKKTAKENPDKGMDKETAKILQVRKLAIEEAIKLQVDNSAQRGALINQLDNAVTRLNDAKTDAEVQKINGEINAIQTSILALEHEMKDQERTFQLAQAAQEQEEIQKWVEEERAGIKRQQKLREKGIKKLEEYEKKLKEDPTDRSNPLWVEDGSSLRKLRDQMVENEKKGDFSGKGLSLPGFGASKEPKKMTEINFSALGYPKDTPDEKVAEIQRKWLAKKIIVIDDRAEMDE